MRNQKRKPRRTSASPRPKRRRAGKDLLARGRRTAKRARKHARRPAGKDPWVQERETGKRGRKGVGRPSSPGLWRTGKDPWARGKEKWARKGKTKKRLQGRKTVKRTREDARQPSYLSSKQGPTVNASKTALAQGLHLLQWLWNRSLKPEDLKEHYILTWFAHMNGNVSQQASRLGLHRNTILVHFKQERGTLKTMKLRFIWRDIQGSFPKEPFHKHLYRFYRKVARPPILKQSENKDLVRLWLMRFPLRALRLHYVRWAFRSGFTHKKIAQALGVSGRTIYREKYPAIRESSEMKKWLLPPKAK